MQNKFDGRLEAGQQARKSLAHGGDHRKVAESRGFGQPGADSGLSRSGVGISDEASHRISRGWQLPLVSQLIVHKGLGIP